MYKWFNKNAEPLRFCGSTRRVPMYFGATNYAVYAISPLARPVVFNICLAGKSAGINR